MQPQVVVDQTINLVRKLIVSECPFITQSNIENNNKGIIVLHFQPRKDIPRVERITSERPRYEKGRVYLNKKNQECDEDNLLFALDVIESKLYQGRMNAGSIWFHFADGVIIDIETKSSLMVSDC